MKKILLICISVFSYFGMNAQLNLKPSIGIASLPADNTPICTIPTVNQNLSFEEVGYSVGEVIPHFKLFQADGTATDIAEELKKGLPIVLMGGSYTCPVYRRQYAQLEELKNRYEGKVSFFIIYQVEAHPIVDMSPYSGTLWVTGDNVDDSVLCRQATTYGERKANVLLNIQKENIKIPILIDSPCNIWWQNFGPAPNNAYLLKPNGKIFAKHGWFNKSTNDMGSDIDRMLKTTSVDIFTNETLAKVFLDKAEKSLRIEYTKKIPLSVEVYDLNGKCVKQMTEITHPNLNFDISFLSSGLYFYRITSKESGNQTGKLYIE